MVRIDGHKLEEIRTYFRDKADHEIFMAKQEDTELSNEDQTVVYSKYEIKAEDRIKKVLKINPERLFKMGMALDPNGWRAGYTKQTIEKRVQKRRKNKKMAHKSRMINKK